MECIAGSPAGDKVAAAFEACFGTANREVNRATTECYDFETSMEWIQELYANDVCVLHEMGWINWENLTYNWDVVIADVHDLPQEVSQVIYDK